jgi:hypothetical protein
VTERRFLQIIVVLASLIPISAGTAGVLFGPAMVDLAGAAAAHSHYRYLSGLLLAIGIGFLTTVGQIERRSARFRILAALVICGGLGHLLSLIVRGYPGKPMLFGLVMELLVTPALVVWQARVAARTRRGP